MQEVRNDKVQVQGEVMDKTCIYCNKPMFKYTEGVWKCGKGCPYVLQEVSDDGLQEKRKEG